MAAIVFVFLIFPLQATHAQQFDEINGNGVFVHYGFALRSMYVRAKRQKNPQFQPSKNLRKKLFFVFISNENKMHDWNMFLFV